MVKAYFTNSMGYSKPSVDDLLDKQARDQDESKRIEEVKEIQKIVMDDPPELYLYTGASIFGFKKKFHGLPPPVGIPEENYEDIWVEQ
jgi:ABC-type transport system substrate-binding protein